MEKFFVFLTMVIFLFSSCADTSVLADDKGEYIFSNNDNNNNSTFDFECGNGKWELGEKCDGNQKESCSSLFGDNWEGRTVCNEDCELDAFCYLPDGEEDNQCDNDDRWEESRGEECDGTDVPDCDELTTFQNIPSGYILFGSVDCSDDCEIISYCRIIQDDDEEANEFALANGARIFSSYSLSKNLKEKNKEDKVWVITEYDRSLTTVLFPSEY
jgi:hypothetical protein